MLEVVTGLAALLVAVVCIIFVFDPHYEDGLVRRLALSGLGLLAVARVMDLVTTDVSISRIELLMWICLAVLLADQCRSFLGKKATGNKGWRPASPARCGGKVPR